MNKWARRFGLVLIAVASLAFAGVSAEEGASVQRQDKTVHKLTTAFIAADGREAATPALPGCRFIGVWRGGYFSSNDASLWVDEHAGFRDWMADYRGPEGFDAEIVLVQRATLNTTRIPFKGDHRMSHLQTPSQLDLDSGFDVYLCLKPRPLPISPIIRFQNLNPLTLQLTPAPGTVVSGNVVLVSPPGVSEFNSFTIPIAVDTPQTGPLLIPLDVGVPVVPVIGPGLNVSPTPAGPHKLVPLAMTPVANDRTAFVFSVTPNDTLWRPIFRLQLPGAPGPFDFPGPRIFTAFEEQIITLNLPNQLVPTGTDLGDAQLSIPSNTPLAQAPPEARVYQWGSAVVTASPNGDYTVTGTLFNPTDAPVTFTNDSVGLVLTRCDSGVPLLSVRSTLNNTITGRGHTSIDYDWGNRVDLGGGELPEPPDPSSPTFEDDLFEWFDQICLVSEARPALTLP